MLPWLACMAVWCMRVSLMFRSAAESSHCLLGVGLTAGLGVSASALIGMGRAYQH